MRVVDLFVVDAADLLTFAFGCVFVFRVAVAFLDEVAVFLVGVDFFRADVAFAVLVVAAFFLVVVVLFVAIFPLPKNKR